MDSALLPPLPTPAPPDYRERMQAAGFTRTDAVVLPRWNDSAGRAVVWRAYDAWWWGEEAARVAEGWHTARSEKDACLAYLSRQPTARIQAYGVGDREAELTACADSALERCAELVAERDEARELVVRLLLSLPPRRKAADALRDAAEAAVARWAAPR